MERYKFTEKKKEELKMDIDARGALQLAEVFHTCLMKRNETLEEKQKDFLDSMAGAQTEDFKKFRTIFPIEPETCDEILSFAEGSGKDMIDPETVCLYFGGEPHIRYSLRDIAQQGLEGRMAQLMLLAHTLVPISVTKISGGQIEGIYENVDHKVVFHDIRVEESYRASLGDPLLVHYGFGFKPRISADTLEKMKEIQAGNAHFIEACEAIKAVDCGKLHKIFQLMKQGVKK